MASRRSSFWAAVPALVLMAGPACAADDGYQDVFSSVVGAVGLMKSDPAPEIDYRERAPLVLPPRMDLPQPSASVAHPASWPKDPDVERRNRAAEDGRAPSPNLLGNRRDTASKQELAEGRTDKRSESERRMSECGKDGNARNCLVVNPDQLRAESEHYELSNPDNKRDEVQAGIEPDRVYLTQPPKGYLKTTKTIKVTNEGPKIIHDTSNPNADLVYKAPQD